MPKFIMIAALLLLSAFNAPVAYGMDIIAQQDATAARIFVYFTIGKDHAPATNVTQAQFESHLKLLKHGGYKVMKLEDIIAAYEQKRPLPDNSVAITFDGGDKSVLSHAAPLLEKYKFPFTVFIASRRADQNDKRYLNWNDIRLLRKSPLVSLGMHPEIYENMSGKKAEYIRRKINNATARFSKKISYKPKLFAYPHGMFDAVGYTILESYNFKAAFGQQSGVAHQSYDRFMLPRFSMTEDYADIDRFQMTANALPLPITELHPKYPLTETTTPAIGFTSAAHIPPHLRCFASGQNNPKLETMGENRLEIRLLEPIADSRFRVNCTAAVTEESDTAPTRWRWFGMLYGVNEALLREAYDKHEMKNEPEIIEAQD